MDTVTVSRTSSLNQLFHKRSRANTMENNSSNNSAVKSASTIVTPNRLSRQRSISELVSRVKLSLRSNSTGSANRRPLKPISCYSSKAEDYDVLRTIGSGATASVYSAIHKPNGSVIAIKTVNLEQVSLDDGRLEALRKEIQIMTLCRHPHLLEVYQSFVHSSQLYIITPIMSAGSCHDLLSRCHKQGFEEIIVACIMRQVGQGLEYLHGNDLIHRDIKSANMLIDFDKGNVKLADFGVSNHLLTNLQELPKQKNYFYDLLQEDNKLLVPQSQKKAARRSFVGTPCWMAPEILLNQDYDTKVDIWSLGITCLELACGKPPFAEYDPLTIFSMIINDPSPTLYTNQIKYVPSMQIQDFIDQCLNKDPEQRISIHEALQHPFLKRANLTPQLLQRYLAKKPELNKRDYLTTRSSRKSCTNSYFDDADYDDEEEDDSWDELDFINSTWNFNHPTQHNTMMINTSQLNNSRVNPLTESPITPEDDVNELLLDEEDSIVFHTRITNHRNNKRSASAENEFLLTKNYYY